MNLSHKLEKILMTEINDRLSQKDKAQALKICKQIEAQIHQLVDIYQRGAIKNNLLVLFRGRLKLYHHGSLTLDPAKTDAAVLQHHQELVSRFEVLFIAALNALQDQVLASLVQQKFCLFERLAHKADEADQFCETIDLMQDQINNFEREMINDEKQAGFYLDQTAILKIQLQKIETRLLELDSESLPNCKKIKSFEILSQKIRQCQKKIDYKHKKALRIFFSQVTTIYQKYLNLVPDLSNLETLINYKETLQKHKEFFKRIGEQDRVAQIDTFINIMEEGINTLQAKVLEHKQQDKVYLDQKSKDIQDAYEQYLTIKNDYIQDQIDNVKDSALKLTTLVMILEANGQRVKAREIKRFLHSTHINQHLPPITKSNALTYKHAFFLLLPFTIILGLIIIFL